MGRKKTKVKAEKAKDDKLEKLRLYVEQRAKQTKSEVVVRARAKPVERRLFGIETVDTLTGGMPKGSWTVLTGPEKTGKSTLAYRAAGTAIRNGERVTLVDVEDNAGKNMEWMNKQGLDTSVEGQLIIVSGSDMEAVCEELFEQIEQEVTDLIIIDSISALVPRGMKQAKSGKPRGMTDDTISLQARQMNKFADLAVSYSFAAKGISFILISQVYMDINPYGGGWKDKLSTRMKHYSDLRLKFSRGKKQTYPAIGPANKQEIIGFSSVIKIDKVKHDNSAAEGKSIMLPFVFGTGWHEAGILFNEAFAYGLLEREGRMYSIAGQTFNGRKALDEWVYNDPNAAGLLRSIVEPIRGTEAANIQDTEEASDDEEPEG